MRVAAALDGHVGNEPPPVVGAEVVARERLERHLRHRRVEEEEQPQSDWKCRLHDGAPPQYCSGQHHEDQHQRQECPETQPCTVAGCASTREQRRNSAEAKGDRDFEGAQHAHDGRREARVVHRGDLGRHEVETDENLERRGCDGQGAADEALRRDGQPTMGHGDHADGESAQAQQTSAVAQGRERQLLFTWTTARGPPMCRRLIVVAARAGAQLAEGTRQPAHAVARWVGTANAAGQLRRRAGVGTSPQVERLSRRAEVPTLER